MSRSLIIMPDEGVQPLLDAIAGAKQHLRVKMFLFDDPALLGAVIAAEQRGVKVRVILNPARRGGEPENEATRKKLESAGVEVVDANPEFAVTHEKSAVVDDELALVQSLNWETKNLTETRDYAVTTGHRHEVEEVAACFEADWHRKHFKPDPHAHLIWCPLNGRDRIAEFIDRAKHTLFVQNERYQDQVIIERLVRAAARGVKIHVMARPPHTLKQDKLVEGVGGIRILDDVGVKVHKLKHLKLHAKMLLADGERAIVGSINFSPGSFDSRRELAIEVDDHHVVKALHKIAEHDWEHSHPLDLTDAGLLADLAKRGGKGAEKLALKVKAEPKPKAGAKAKAKPKAKAKAKAKPTATATAKAKAKAKAKKKP
ncbi:MAG TPA: phospholipase D-like domain-containing protein [Burkholderiales bacterium]|nr:phospholipase D-like domain-containing protein [Burkholderiales bacterium]